MDSLVLICQRTAKLAIRLITGNTLLPGTRTDGEQTLRRVGHSSPDLCRVKKEKSPLTSTTNSYTMSFATKFSRRFVVSPYAARPIGRRLSEPPPPDANTELQEYEWKVALQNSPTLVGFQQYPIPMFIEVPL